jgi:tRNA pseudouridine32 synthase/23S rRNA pseudouridine746 synthase
MDSLPKSQPAVGVAGIDVVFADAALLVLDKPSGLLAVPGRGDDKADCLSARAVAAYPDALVVHRLDMATSGLMLMARGAHSQRQLSRQFSGREVAKRYIAIVAGQPAPAAGEIDLPLISDWPNRPKHKVDLAIGKPSRTRYRTLSAAPDRDGDAWRVELEPVTGRTHQLRIHLAAIGHPILGDALYAGAAIHAAAERLLLHASELTIRHPETGAAISFSSPPPF